MSKQNNTLVTVGRQSMRLAHKYMQPYSCAKSPHKFRQAQLVTCLILQAYLKSTYRGVIDILDASEILGKTIGLKGLPHYSTLKYFADRAGTLDVVDVMLKEVTQQFVKKDERVAVDSTGLETTAASS